MKSAIYVNESVQITNYLHNSISWSIPIRYEYFKSFVCKHNQERIRLYIIRAEHGSATSLHHLLSYFIFHSSIMHMQCNVLPTSDYLTLKCAPITQWREAAHQRALV